MLNLHKLEIFLRVVNEGSFSSAAEHLLMTQSGVSQHIRDLERGLGVQLFVRSRRGVALTPAGETLHRYSRQIFALVAEAENAVTDVTQLPAGRVTVDATPGVSAYVLAEWIESFRNRHPNLTVILQTKITPQIAGDIWAQRADVAFVEGEFDAETEAQLGVKVLETIDQLVIVGQKHSFWNRSTVEIQELDGETFIMRQPASQTRIWLDRVLQECDVHPRVGAEFDNVESIKRAVIAGAALTILPAYVIRDEQAFGLLRAVPVASHLLQRTLKLVWDKQRFWSPVTLALFVHLQTRFPALRAEIKQIAPKLLTPGSAGNS